MQEQQKETTKLVHNLASKVEGIDKEVTDFTLTKGINAKTSKRIHKDLLVGMNVQNICHGCDRS